MTISLLLETDILVSHKPVLILEKQHQPLSHIPHIEKHEQHLTHLGSVNALMVDFLGMETHPVPHENHAKEVDGIEFLRRYVTIVNNHAAKIRVLMKNEK